MAGSTGRSACVCDGCQVKSRPPASSAAERWCGSAYGLPIASSGTIGREAGLHIRGCRDQEVLADAEQFVRLGP